MGTVFKADSEEIVKEYIAEEMGITVEELENFNNIVIHEKYDITEL